MKKVFNLIILDESGSMESVKSLIISGFNELVQNIKNLKKDFADQEHFVSLVTFNGMGIKTIMDNISADYLGQINESVYKPNSMTPLFDAIGDSVNKLKQITKRQDNCNVLVTILTDGLENASKEYSGKDIKKLIDNLRNMGWTFTYIGTDHDIDKVADSISINNKLSFNKSEEGIREMFTCESKARNAYYNAVSENSDELGKDFDFFKKHFKKETE